MSPLKIPTQSSRPLWKSSPFDPWSNLIFEFLENQIFSSDLTNLQIWVGLFYIQMKQVEKGFFRLLTGPVNARLVCSVSAHWRKTSPQAKRHKSSLHVIFLHFFSLLWLFSLLLQFNFFDYFRFLDYFHLFEYLHFFEYFHLFKNFKFFDFVTSFTIPTSSQQVKIVIVQEAKIVKEVKLSKKWK